MSSLIDAADLATKHDALLWDVLRWHHEPYVRIDELSVHEGLSADPRGYLSFLERNLTDLAMGRSELELPAKQIFTDPESGGDFRVMPCTVREGKRTLKTVKIVGTNRTEVVVQDQITVGKVFRLHPKDNFITHVVDACLFSSARTGACAAIGLKSLAPDAQTVTIVGSGRVGWYAGFFCSVLPSVKEVVFTDRSPKRSAALTELARRDLGGSVRFRDGGRRPPEGDVVILATTSAMPLYDPDDIAAELVVSVGADADEQSELPQSWAKAADIYVDSVDSTRVGDLRSWLESGVITEKDVVDLFTVLRDGPPNSSRRKLFVSTGSALMDNLTIGYLIPDES